MHVYTHFFLCMYVCMYVCTAQAGLAKFSDCGMETSRRAERHWADMREVQ